mmetsp:Transcript_37185/g.78916  ORF Transcript_37185/g.78916 Transcript_37185/m.78916 type:complete len:81 (-) Transcript_37185:503-745(-)
MEIWIVVADFPEHQSPMHAMWRPRNCTTRRSLIKKCPPLERVGASPRVGEAWLDSSNAEDPATLGELLEATGLEPRRLIP